MTGRKKIRLALAVLTLAATITKFVTVAITGEHTEFDLLFWIAVAACWMFISLIDLLPARSR